MYRANVLCTGQKQVVHLQLQHDDWRIQKTLKIITKTMNIIIYKVKKLSLIKREYKLQNIDSGN
jgi:hypothetical protein